MKFRRNYTRWRNFFFASAIVCMPCFLVTGNVLGASQYTDKQLEAFETRVGKIYWVRSQDGNLPAFLSAPSSKAAEFTPRQNESFEILELYGRATKEPYYKVKFESGQLAYIRPEQFHEQFNLTITSIDPLASQRRHAEEQSKAEEDRVEWINSQPWSPQVKQAAVDKQPTPGLNTSEVKRILGEPRRITKLRGVTKNAEEQWFYPDGTVLIFTNGLLSRTERRTDGKNNPTGK
jgi:hypothetical protein